MVAWVWIPLKKNYGVIAFLDEMLIRWVYFRLSCIMVPIYFADMSDSWPRSPEVGCGWYKAP